MNRITSLTLLRRSLTLFPIVPFHKIEVRVIGIVLAVLVVRPKTVVRSYLVSRKLAL